MASYDKKKFKETGQAYCYYYSQEGKQIWIPRSDTKHLDHGFESNLKYFCSQIESKFGRHSNRIYQPTRPYVSEELLKKFLEHCKKRNDETTAEGKISLLNRFVLPYFTQNTEEGQACQSFHRWIDKSLRLYQYVTRLGNSAHIARSCNTAAQSFWTFLKEYQYLPVDIFPLPLTSPPRGERISIKREAISRVSLDIAQQFFNHDDDEDTPLDSTITVDEMLSWARQQSDNSMKLIGLVGYFASLRSQEILALKPEYFLASETARQIPKCRAMGTYQWKDTNENLFGGMAINVFNQLDTRNNLKRTKGYSRGQSAVFNKDAAFMIAEILENLRQRDRWNFWLFPRNPNYYFHNWRRFSPKACSIKDLRRASIWELAHLSNIDVHGLTSHARHRDPKTTLLYYRSPNHQGNHSPQRPFVIS